MGAVSSALDAGRGTVRLYREHTSDHGAESETGCSRWLCPSVVPVALQTHLPLYSDASGGLPVRSRGWVTLSHRELCPATMMAQGWQLPDSSRWHGLTRSDLGVHPILDAHLHRRHLLHLLPCRLDFAPTLLDTLPATTKASSSPSATTRRQTAHPIDCRSQETVGGVTTPCQKAEGKAEETAAMACILTASGDDGHSGCRRTGQRDCCGICAGRRIYCGFIQHVDVSWHSLFCPSLPHPSLSPCRGFRQAAIDRASLMARWIPFLWAFIQVCVLIIS